MECLWYVHRRNRDEAKRTGVPHLVFEGDGVPFDVMAEAAFQNAAAVDLREHITAFLGGLYLDRIQARITSVTIQYLYYSCWSCRRVSTIWKISGAALLSCCQRTADFIRAESPVLPSERIESLVVTEVASVLGKGGHPPMAPLRMHYSEAAGKTYHAYGCAHCTTGFFGDAFLARRDDWEAIVVSVVSWLPLSDNILTQVHLCRDKGLGRAARTCFDIQGQRLTGMLKVGTSLGSAHVQMIQTTPIRERRSLLLTR